MIIYFHGSGKETTESEHIGTLFDWSNVRNICAACRGRSGRQPSLILKVCAIHTSQCQMVSYLMVRLEMQYLHIAFHMAVTSPDASDVPQKNRHGTNRKLEPMLKKQEIALTPPLKEPQKVQCVLTPTRTTNYTPHPSLSIEKPTEKCILLLLKLLCLCSFEVLPAPVRSELLLSHAAL